MTDKNYLPGVGTQPHYTSCKIQPIDFIVENGLDFLEGNVIKYVARYKRKNGLEDLRKAQQYLLWLIDREQERANKKELYSGYWPSYKQRIAALKRSPLVVAYRNVT